MGVTRRRAYCDTVALFTLPSMLPLPSGLVCNTNHFNKNPITSTGFNALLLSNLYFGNTRHHQFAQLPSSYRLRTAQTQTTGNESWPRTSCGLSNQLDPAEYSRPQVIKA